MATLPRLIALSSLLLSAQLLANGTRDVIPIPPAPALPAAGGTYVDPAFGSRILRVTDSSDGSDCGVAYSYWPTFNANSTRLHLRCDGKAYLYAFDPAGFRLASRKEPLFARPTPAGTSPNAEDAIWSARDPAILFAHDLRKLWAYNVSSRTFTLVADIGSQLPAGWVIFQMSKSRDDNVFAWTIKDAEYGVAGYLVYRRDLNKIVARVATRQLDEVQVDKSGRFLVVKTGLEAAGQVRVIVVDLTSGSSRQLKAGAPDFACGHSDNALGATVGLDNFNNTVQLRSLSNTGPVRNLLSFGPDWTQAHHVSMLADDEAWALVSAYSGQLAGQQPGAFRGEIFLVATDGSQRVRRLAHHRSILAEYYDTPRANISKDGRFAAYTSNWGGSGVRSVFVLKLR